MAGAGRERQKSRTRRDLLEAALETVADGQASLEAIAERAGVSRATAYRYFPNVEGLLAEAGLHVAFPGPECLADAGDDPVERLFRIDEAVEAMITSHEAALRVMIAQASTLPIRSAGIPVRQNRREPLIEAALAPARDGFHPDSFRQLVRALSLVIGTEAMLVFNDVLQLDRSAARDARRWTIRALIEAARIARPIA